MKTKIIGDKEVEVTTDKPYTVVYSLAVVRNLYGPLYSELYVPTMHFGAKSKKEIRDF